MEMCMEDLITREAAVAAMEMARATFPVPDGAIPGIYVNAVISAAVEALKNAPSAWKSVDDEWPERQMRVLCYYPEREDVLIADLDTNVDGNDIWVDDSGYISDREDVTLWAPLPAPKG